MANRFFHHQPGSFAKLFNKAFSELEIEEKQEELWQEELNDHIKSNGNH